MKNTRDAFHSGAGTMRGGTCPLEQSVNISGSVILVRILSTRTMTSSSKIMGTFMTGHHRLEIGQVF